MGWKSHCVPLQAKEPTPPSAMRNGVSANWSDALRNKQNFPLIEQDALRGLKRMKTDWKCFSPVHRACAD
jgi:hypothetical protein